MTLRTDRLTETVSAEEGEVGRWRSCTGSKASQGPGAEGRKGRRLWLSGPGKAVLTAPAGVGPVFGFTS